MAPTTMPTSRPSADPAPKVARAFRWLAFSTWLLLIVGASVRVHGAGMACPDWPLCFGELIPQMDFTVFLEWGHRVLAAVESFGLLALTIVVFRNPELRARVGAWVIATNVVLLIQIILGGLTVLHLLAEWTVTSHFLTGNAFFVMLALTAERLDPPRSEPSPVAPLAGVLAALVVVQLGIGAYTSSSEAGLACTEWPTCNGGVWFPALDGIIGLHLLHRMTGYLVLVLALSVAWLGRSHPLRGRMFAAAALVMLQATLGIAAVLGGLAVEVAILHSAVADLILLFTLTTAVALARPLLAPVRALEQA